MKVPRIERVHTDYEPGYPAGLTAEQFAALLASDRQRRLLTAAAAAGLTIGTLAAQDGTDAADRERKVLEVLTRAVTGDSTGSSFWYPRTTFERTKNECGSTVVVPRIPIMFGNSRNGVFDAERARQLARGMFEAYGLRPAADVDIGDGDTGAELDGFDRHRRVGFELNGRPDGEPGMAGGVAAEAPSDELSKDEHAKLAADGIEIHLVDLANYPLMDGDQVTPTVAYLAGIVAFLNEVTDGPDIDLDAVLLRRSQRFPMSPIDAPAGVEVRHDERQVTLTVEKAISVPIAIDPAKSVQVAAEGSRRFDRWDDAERPLPTVGRPTVIRLAHRPGSAGTPAPRVRIVQAATKLDVVITAPVGFLPSGFDATRPFMLILQLEPGVHVIDTHVQVGVAGD